MESKKEVKVIKLDPEKELVKAILNRKRPDYTSLVLKNTKSF